MSELILWFSRSPEHIELERTVYVDHYGAETVAIRGKNSGAYKGAGVFQWTPGVRALTVVFVEALVRHLKQISTFLPLLEGEKGSLAFSLHYALAKQPAWLFEMFGSDEDGNANLRKILFRSSLGTNKVAVSLNEEALSASSVKVYIDRTELRSVEALERLLYELLGDEASEAQKDIPRAWVLLRSKHSSSSQKHDSQPAAKSIFEPDNIYLFEQLQYPSSSTADRLRWDQLDDQRPSSIFGRVVQAKHLFEELTYQTCDDQTRSQFEQWLATMQPYPDAEWGIDTEREGRLVPGFISSLKGHNRQFTPNGFHRTFIWRDRLTKELVATLTLGRDDRGVSESNQLDRDGTILGINVRWDLRNRGIGHYLVACINKHIIDFVKRDGKSRLIHTSNYNFGGVPWPMLKKIGYEKIASLGPVQTDFGFIPIWSKTYLA